MADKDLQESIKRFNLLLKIIVESLNITVSEDVESLLLAYNKSVELAKSPPMANFDVYTFLPHLRLHKDYLRPLVLHSGGRNAGNLVVMLQPRNKRLTY